jgi:exopolysaccharide biosynthesis polyprenyl glycosylphosphotransferase
LKKKNNKKLPVALLALGDVILVTAGYLLAFYIRYLGDIPTRNFEAFKGLLPYIIVSVVVIFYSLGLYERRFKPLSHVLKSTTIALIIIGLFSTSIAFWSRDFAFPRTVIALSFILHNLLLAMWRALCHWLDKKRGGQKRVLIITGENSNTADNYFNSLPRGWFLLVGELNQNEIKRINRIDNQIDVVLMMPDVEKNIRSTISEACIEQDIELYMAPTVDDLLINKASFISISDHPVMRIDMMGLSTTNRVLKRTMDIVIAGFGLLVVLPILAMVSLAIKLTSKGPIMYIQERVGINGKVFNIYKMRTMIVDAEEVSGPILAGKNDARITKVGKLLRKTRLDELPQLINVLKGEMSIVGPRPERAYFVRKYGEYVPHYNLRHIYKPGLTGLAQIQGKYTTSVEDKVRYDLYYISNYSIFLDIKIMIQTFPILISGESSEGYINSKGKNNFAVNSKRISG